ncbi:MAG: hypothetical protein IT558_01015 [Alphaproteobacteria bacterium]|nr:hypothetical protein [Alphaproteobacteria bacterium]
MSNDQSQIENAEIIIQRFGGIRPMASKMSVPVTTVQGWKKRNAIPANRLEEIISAARAHDIDISDIAALSANENQKAGGQAEGSSAPAAPRIPDLQGERLSAVPRSSSGVMPNVVYEDLYKKLSEAEQKAIRKSSMINAVFVLLAAGAVVGLLWPHSKAVTQNSKRLETIEREIAELESDMAQAQKKAEEAKAPSVEMPSLGSLQQQAAQIPGQVQAAVQETQAALNEVFGPGAGNFQQRAANLQERVQEMAGSPALVSLLERYEQWQNEPAGRDQLSQLSYGLYSTLTNFQGPPEEINSALDVARTRNPSLGKAFEGVPQQDLKAAAMLLAMAEFRSSLNRDNVPFEQDLQILKSLAGKDDPALIEALDRLAPQAQEGILTPQGLTNEFKTITGDAITASLSGKDVSVQERAAARFNQIFQVKKDGEMITGTPTQANVAKAQQQLESGDIEGAIGALQKLEGPAAAAVAPWIGKAQMTLAAQKFKNMLTSNINLRAYGPGAVASSGSLSNPVAGASALRPPSAFGIQDNLPRNPYATP